MDFATLFIILMIVIFTGVGWVVFWAIKHAQKNNMTYKNFASEHGYEFDQAQGNDNYRDYSTNVTRNEKTVTLSQSPFVEKYANFTQYPFGHGTERKVAYVISGDYKNTPFQAFTYHFVGQDSDKSKPGGVFSIVLIQCPDTPRRQLTDQMFYENGLLCEYQQGNLNVETIHERIDRLRKLV